MVAGVFANGGATAQADAVGEIAALIKGNFVTAADATAGIISAFALRAATIQDVAACGELCLRVHRHTRAGEVVAGRPRVQTFVNHLL